MFDNRGSYQREVRQFIHDNALFTGEACTLRLIAAEVAGQPVLDLGVGGGRTTASLLDLSHGNYVGVDYAEAMVAACRGRFPQARFEVADARDLGAFGDGQFGLVMFSFNGLDYVDHAGRLRALAEIHRVLRPGGHFAFSAHNLGNRPMTALHPANIVPTANPLRLAKRLAVYGLGISNYVRGQIRHRRLLAHRGDYAYRIDCGLNYTLVTYYIDPAAQVRQLRDAGFKVEAILDDHGHQVSAEARLTTPYLFYLARKGQG